MKKRDSNKRKKPIYVVGIGASAGGLTALESFIHALPKTTETSYVIIQHLDPKHKSEMASILKRYSSSDIHEIKDGEQLKANTIYLKPPGKDLVIKNQVFLLVDPLNSAGINLPIDRFFKSLAFEYKEKSVGVILSGTGSDGSLGVKEIKTAGGVVFVQDTSEAQYSSMPHSAIETQAVDFILPVAMIGKSIAKYHNHLLKPQRKIQQELETHLWQLTQKKILDLVHQKTGHDFSNYKKTTIARRIKRRMSMQQLEDIELYLTLLKGNDSEVELLFKDLTIRVTNFFRNPEAFDALKTKAVLPLVKNCSKNAVLRIWVPACDTGEEAYSIAMVCFEVMEELNHFVSLQIFASDIDADAIQSARKGVYRLNIAGDVDENRLKRFFTKTESGFIVKKELREKIVFAEQNIISDPPFSKLDLVSCRNFLIYLDSELQKKVLPLFHYVLKSDGILFLGLSENIAGFSQLFLGIDKKNKIFKNKKAYQTNAVSLRAGYNIFTIGKTVNGLNMNKERKIDVGRISEKLILKRFSPATILIDSNFEILYFSGNTNQFLSNPKGHRSFNALEMARWGLRTKIREGVKEVQKTQKTIVYENCSVKQNGDFKMVDVTVEPVTDLDVSEILFLIVFEERKPCPSVEQSDSMSTVDDVERKQLEQELLSTRADLQATIEELETSNEELQSVNEELQSTNEELETSREEIQATNEELSTVNAELQQKVEELFIAKNDANNLLENTDIGTIFLDENLHIKRFTPKVKKIFNIRESDIDRPLSDITTKLNYKKLYEDAKETLDTLTRREVNTSDEIGDQYVVRVFPYRTMDNRINGVVLTFIDITILTNMKQYTKALINSFDKPILILNSKLLIYAANDMFLETFDLKAKDVESVSIYSLDGGQWETPAFKNLFEKIIPQQFQFKQYAVELKCKKLGGVSLVLSGGKIQVKDMAEPMMLISVDGLSLEKEEKNGK